MKIPKVLTFHYHTGKNIVFEERSSQFCREMIKSRLNKLRTNFSEDFQMAQRQKTNVGHYTWDTCYIEKLE